MYCPMAAKPVGPGLLGPGGTGAPGVRSGSGGEEGGTVTKALSAAELVGRAEEIEVLERTLRDARAGCGRTVFVVGEPGIGKTRLLAEVVDRAQRRGMVVLKGRCTTSGPAVPFRPLSEALMSLARTGVTPSAAELGAYLPVLGRLVPDWSTGQIGDQSLVVLAEAVLRLCIEQGSRRGCLLVVDDLHDADPETVAVLEYLSSNVTGQNLAVLATTRPVAGPAYELANSAAQRREGLLLALDRLGEADTRALAAGSLGCLPREVSDRVAHRIFHGSGGNPFVAEELIRAMLAGSELRFQQGAWRLSDAGRAALPFTLVRAVESRAARLGPHGPGVLSTAAVLGRSFPFPVVGECVELTDAELLTYLQGAVADGLLLADERGPSWYAFEHPLTVEALVSRLSPVERTGLSRRAADAVERLYPGLPGSWCHLTARLLRQAGEVTAAARLYHEAAGRALAERGPGTAISVLDEALHMLATTRGTDAAWPREDDAAVPAGQDDAPVPARQDVWDGDARELLETLLLALTDDGRFDRAVRLADRMRGADAVIGPERRIRLHARLAWAAQVAGRWEEGLRQVAAARALLPPNSPRSRTASIDAVEAYLTVGLPEPGRIAASEALARRAIGGAQDLGDPALECQARYAVGFAARRRSLVESNDCFRRTLEIATEANLVVWRNHGLIGLGNNAWIGEADSGPLSYAHEEALRTGWVSLALNAGAMLAFDALLRCDFEWALETIDGSLAETTRLRLHSVTRYLLMLKACVAAHRADRAAMRAALAEFREHGGERSREAPLARGMAELICALLEEDPAEAAAVARELAAALPDDENFFHLIGTHGLMLLLAVLEGRAGPAEVERTRAGQAGQMRWNRQFVELARAVLLGRDGHTREAERAARASLESSAPFPTGRHLGLRLVADAALADGWGDPAGWLLQAEEYFFHHGVPAVASACRAQLRRAGVPVRQRRTGTDRIPGSLRSLGVTAREFDVFQLLAERLSNKSLADRLHISDRTVEKHVASLLGKTGSADRRRLCDFAADALPPAASRSTASDRTESDDTVPERAGSGTGAWRRSGPPG